MNRNRSASWSSGHSKWTLDFDQPQPTGRGCGETRWARLGNKIVAVTLTSHVFSHPRRPHGAFVELPKRAK